MNVFIVLLAFGGAVVLYLLCVSLQRRNVPDWLRYPFRAAVNDHPQTVLVSGATGFVGQQLCRQIIERGDRLIVLTRDSQRARNLFGPHAHVVTSLTQLGVDQEINAIVNLAGASIMGAPWTQKRREVLLESRLTVTNALVDLIVRLKHKPRVLVSMSAIGYYGVRGDEEITEADHGRPVFQSHLCQAWELAAQRAKQYGVRVCRLRSGVVLGAQGGALPQLARGARLRFTTVLGRGDQWQSWIHLDDLLGLIERCIDDANWSGPFNATAPRSERQAQFANALSARFGRSLTLHVPDRLLRLMLGEMAQLLVDGQRVLPMNALSAGFEFKYPTLERALANLFPKNQEARVAAPAEIFYDPVCPVCDFEMRRYCNDSRRNGLAWAFADVAARPEIMNQCRIDGDTARRRIYLVDSQGRIRSGIDALISIWSALPRWRVVAWIVSLPGIYRAVNLVYDLLLAPVIWRWSTRRRARGITAVVPSH